MTRLWHLAFLVAVACVVASGFWWQARKDAWNPPTPLRPDLPQTVELPLPAAISAQQARARPLMWSSRRPADTNAEGRKNDQERDFAQSRLLAVLESGGERVALVQRQDGASLKLTGQTRPWRIESFDGRLAVFVSNDGRRVELALERTTTVKPAAPRADQRLPRS